MAKKKKETAPIDIDAAMARLILLRKFHELPRPVSYEISTGEYGTFQGIYVYVHTGQNVTAWADALGVDEHSRGSFTGHDGSVNFDATRRDWNGWYVRVVSRVPYPAPAPSELDADTVAGLEEIAAPAEAKPLVSDATIAEAEQISKMVAPLDMLLPQAECGCPIKGSGASKYVDHCQACYDRPAGVSA